MPRPSLDTGCERIVAHWADSYAASTKRCRLGLMDSIAGGSGHFTNLFQQSVARTGDWRKASTSWARQL